MLGNIMPVWPDLSSFPPWVNTIAGALFALGIAGVALAAFFGRIRGTLIPPEGRHDSAQIAMMALDSTAIREHTAAVKEVAIGLERLNAVGREYLDSLEQRQEENELRAAEKRGYERAQAERVRAPRKPPVKKGGGMNFTPDNR
jgi:hypothetical protein